MRENACAIQPLPSERVVREGGQEAPGNFLREEGSETGTAQQLRHLSRVAEGVRQPEGGVCGVEPELALEEQLAVEHLADQTLAAGQVGVRLHPAATDRDEATSRDCAAHAFEQLRVVLLEP